MGKHVQWDEHLNALREICDDDICKKDKDKLNTAIAALAGTSNELFDELEQAGFENANSIPLSYYIYIDSKIALCSECEWWCYLSDLTEDENGELLCYSCHGGIQ